MKINKKNNKYILMIKMIILSIFLLTTSISTTVISDEQNQNNSPDNESDITLSYLVSFAEPKIQSIQLFDQDFSKISMSGTFLTSQKRGDPTIPAKPITILLPQGTEYEDISVTSDECIIIDTNAKGVNLKNHPIAPYQGQIPIGSPPPENLIFNEKTYMDTSSIPGKLQDHVSIGYCRGYTMLTVTLYPTNYNPSEGILSYNPTMKINIDLKETGNTHPFYRGLTDDKNWVQSLVMNKEIISTYQSSKGSFYPAGLCSPSDNNGIGYDYVIITTETLYDFSETYTWDDLIEKKESEGLSATKVKVEDIVTCPDYWNSSNPLFNDSAALIREFCKDAYQDWNTQYILIGGDDNGPNMIERREMDGAAETGVETDIYWTHLDNTFNNDGDTKWGEEEDGGFDYYSEMYSGSIPCDEGIDVSNWLTKSFYYADAYDVDYLENAAFYGGDTGWDAQGDTIIEFSAILGTDDWMGPNPEGDGPYPAWLGFQWGFETWNTHHPWSAFNLSVKWTGEPPNPGWQGGSGSAAVDGLKNAINNNQCTIISAVAHANSGMSMDVYSSSWESNYHNTRPFFLTDQGCHCGDMDASDDGVLHSMLFHSDTELAFACIYNTGYGWGNYDGTNASSAIQMKSFWDYMFDISNNSQSTNNWQLGKAQEWARDLMAPAINWNPDGDDGSFRNNIQSCLLFGDPAQRLKIPFTPEHDITLESIQIADVVAHGETQTVSANVRNVGNNTETNIVVDFKVNGSIVDTTTIGSLAHMQSTPASFNWDPAIGTYLVSIESQPIPDEYDLLNNQVNKTVSVIAAPAIDVTPSSLTFLVPTESSDSDIFTIENLATAEGVLEYSIVCNDGSKDWLSANPLIGTVAVDDSDDITVSVDSTGLDQGDYQGSVVITSNDLDDPEVTVTVYLTVVYGNDMKAVSVNSPTGIITAGSYVINATVQNLGSYPQTGVLVNCSIFEGFLDYDEDFEADDGEYVVSGGLWEYGTPTSGPSGAHSGSYCWGTDLDGNYGNNENARLDSPEITLPDGVTAALSFWHWYDTENYYDGGNVKISTDSGTYWEVLGEYQNPYPEDSASSSNSGIPGEPCFSSSSSGWQLVSFDLSAYAGETVMFRWHFGSDGSMTDPGWFIDDVSVVGEYGSKDGNTIVFSTTETVSLDPYETMFVEFTPDWVAVGGNYTIKITTLLPGDEDNSNNVTSDVVIVSGPTLSFDPVSYNAGTMMINTTDTTSFDIWNSGVGTLTYTLSEPCDWINLSSYGGVSTGEHDTISVDINTTGLASGSSYHCDIMISSNGGSDVFGVDVYIVSSSTEILDVDQPLYDRGFPIRHAIDGDWAAAQDFTPTLGMISSVDLYIRVFGSPEFDLTVELRSGSPDGILIDSLVFTPGEVPSSWDWLHVDFDDEIVTPGVDYFVVIPPAPGGVTTSFGYEWGYAIGDVYGDGSFWFTRDGGGLWRDLPDTYEFAFRTYGLI